MKKEKKRQDLVSFSDMSVKYVGLAVQNVLNILEQ